MSSSKLVRSLLPSNQTRSKPGHKKEILRPFPIRFRRHCPPEHRYHSQEELLRPQEEVEGEKGEREEEKVS